MPAEPEPIHGGAVQGEPAPLHAENPAGGWRTPLLVAVLVGLGGLAAFFWLGRPGAEPAAPPVPDHLPPLSSEADAYLPQIELGPLELSRWQNFLGQQVTYLDLTLANRGRRRVIAVELTVEFLDPYQAVVLRENVRPVGGRSLPGIRRGPLAPGESRPVRIAFEHLPADWDRRPPRVRVTGLLLD
jgi:hypothetical protein